MCSKYSNCEASMFEADCAVVLKSVCYCVACFLLLCHYHVEMSSGSLVVGRDFPMCPGFFCILFIAELRIGRRHNVYGACRDFCCTSSVNELMKSCFKSSDV